MSKNTKLDVEDGQGSDVSRAQGGLRPSFANPACSHSLRTCPNRPPSIRSRQAAMAISSNPLSSTRKSARATVVSPLPQSYDIIKR
jgi:hypothetical protein